MILKCCDLLSDKKLFKQACTEVLTKWKYACEQNLTNDSMNKIAYIGQVACCYMFKAPSTITIDAWHKLTDKQKDIANAIAHVELDKYMKEINKGLQLCLKLD